MDIPKKLGIKDTDFRGVFGRTKIDYDPDKEDFNRKKHGYSLQSAAISLSGGSCQFHLHHLSPAIQ